MDSAEEVVPRDELAEADAAYAEEAVPRDELAEVEASCSLVTERSLLLGLV